MRRLTFGAAIAATLALSACSKDKITEPTLTVNQDDYSLVMFGQSGMALQGTLGAQGTAHGFDGHTGQPNFPDSLKLTDDQKAQIDALHAAFQTAHQAALDSLKSLFEQARAAHEAGATRDSVRAILEQGRGIGQALQTAVDALHTAILNVLTPAQEAWLDAHRPLPPPDVDGHSRPPLAPRNRH